jgi:hypothetical protein
MEVCQGTGMRPSQDHPAIHPAGQRQADGLFSTEVSGEEPAPRFLLTSRKIQIRLTPAGFPMIPA